ncbi:MAG: pyridoxal phosphate-dependent aminotransferase [Clostridiales bacterium]|nr:pyridoxal phosphate-dependent aminotransferase [Clostridiales bacterium]
MFSKKITANLQKSSWIRAMFEEGEKLRKIYGDENIYDFSIGNPDLPPPLEVSLSLAKLAASTDSSIHRYMSNAGHSKVRMKIAEYINIKHGTAIPQENIVMTCGAAGALNVVLKSILDPGDEVIVFSPYFVEYLFYIDNHGGKPVVVPTMKDSFLPDFEAFSAAISEKTKGVIINSPNNPTGVIYNALVLDQIADILGQKEAKFGTSIYVISDEPYDRIVYDGIKPPCTFNHIKNSIIVNSFSKSLALPGERIGYIAVNSNMKDASELGACLVFCNRTLGFVNAPSLFQLAVAEAIDSTVNVESYKERRDILYSHLINTGFTCIKPEGAFYLFPEALIPDDVEFVKRAQKYNLLLVPGSGFGCPGHFRISYCVNKKIIENSLPAFSALAKEFR